MTYLLFFHEIVISLILLARLNQLLRLYRKHKDKYLVNPHNLGLEVSLKDPAVGVGESDTVKIITY